MSRREARRHAFVLLYQIPFHKPYDAETLAEAFTEYMADKDEKKNINEMDTVYMIRITSGVLENLHKIDEEIQGCLKKWSINRINTIDLALLRLSIYELLFEPEIPVKAAINAAVELAKLYGSDESSSFINGVLATIAERASENACIGNS